MTNLYQNIPHPYSQDNCPDADTVMFHACFGILGIFVEQELGKDDGEESYRGYREHFEDSQRPLIDLWIWYRDEWPLVDGLYMDDMKEHEVEITFGAIDGSDHTKVNITYPKGEPKYPCDWPMIVMQDKLDELMKHRGSMWT